MMDDGWLDCLLHDDDNHQTLELGLKLFVYEIEVV
jgi:hypothetical protein